MGLPYFPMYPTDFEAKTSHLTLEEDGAYNRLLRLCWMMPGCSLPDDDAWIQRRMRVDTETFERVVRVVLDEFFTRKNGRVSNARLTEEFERSNESHKKRVNAGSKGGSAKSLRTNKTASSNAKAKLKQPEPEPELYKNPQTPLEGDLLFDENPGPRKPTVEEQFDDWYSGYPHKVGKGQAVKAFKTAIKTTDLETLKAGLERYKRDKPEDRPWCNPATWLNGERWLDAPAAAKPAGQAVVHQFRADDTIELLNHNQASRSAVIGKLKRWFLGQVPEWRFTAAWSDMHPPGHPGCVIPDDLIQEASRLAAAERQTKAAG